MSIIDISKKRKIDFIRMDVEGHEVDILSSLLDYINETKFFLRFYLSHIYPDIMKEMI